MASPLGSRRAVMFAVAVLVALLALRDQAYQPSPMSELSLAILLREPAEDDRAHESAFFTALSAVARKHGARIEEFAPRCVDGGFAAEIGDGNVVVVLRGWDHCIPGSDTQHLLLLGRNGRLLDRLACGINARLTRCNLGEDSGVFSTDVHSPAEPDGARVVIRYTPEQGGVLGGNFSHEIRRGDSWHSFPWTQEDRGVGPEQWAKKGLCRIAVRDGKFALLFPPSPRD